MRNILVISFILLMLTIRAYAEEVGIRKESVSVHGGLYFDMYEAPRISSNSILSLALDYKYGLLHFNNRVIRGGGGVGVMKSRFEDIVQWQPRLELSVDLVSRVKPKSFFYGICSEFWLNRNIFVFFSSGYMCKITDAISVDMQFKPTIWQSFINDEDRVNKWLWVKGTMVLNFQVGISYNF